MLESLVDKQPALLIPILSILGAILVFTVWIVAAYWNSSQRFAAETALKKDMLARDFAPADIERVLLASVGGSGEGASGGKESVSDNEYYLVEKMLDEGYPAEEIERLVRAFKSGEKVMLPDHHVQA